MRRVALALVVVAAASRAEAAPELEVAVGSKAFTESVILGEITAYLLRDAGADAVHRRELGGTRILWSALGRGDIDVYPEYTGTLRAEIFAGRELPTEQALAAALAAEGFAMTRPLGFENTYAIGVPGKLAERRKLARLSDLARAPDLRIGLSNEFMERADGWPLLRERYGLPQRDVRGLQHDLAYRALESGSIDATDLYSTDAEIVHYGLRVLVDDRGVFPNYDAVLVYRAGLAPAAIRALERLAGSIDAEAMARMNARAKLERTPEAVVAADFVKARLQVAAVAHVERRSQRIWRATREHLWLVGLSLLAAIAVAVPLGIFAARRALAGHAVLGITGIVQTIPSLALLVFMIPLFGIGEWPAIAALFLYSLLPIVRNTHAGLTGIALPLRESALALGLSPSARLRHVELPLAMPAILAGIQTAAVINIGTATLGGLIGAGGYGERILTGIRLDRTDLILEGAIPAAMMALGAQLLFELVERLLVPRPLRLRARGA